MNTASITLRNETTPKLYVDGCSLRNLQRRKGEENTSDPCQVIALLSLSSSQIVKRLLSPKAVHTVSLFEKDGVSILNTKNVRDHDIRYSPKQQLHLYQAKTLSDADIYSAITIEPLGPEPHISTLRHVSAHFRSRCAHREQ